MAQVPSGGSIRTPGLLPGIMQPPPQFPPAQGLRPQATYAQWSPQPQPQPPPLPYIHRTVPALALHSHEFRQPPPPLPPLYSNLPTPYSQGHQPPPPPLLYSNPPAPYSQGNRLQFNMSVQPQIPAGQSMVSLDVKVPNYKRSLIYGKNNSMINWMQSKSGAAIAELTSTASETTFRITGPAQYVAMAKQLMDDALLKGKVHMQTGSPGRPPQRLAGHAYKLPDAGSSQLP